MVMGHLRGEDQPHGKKTHQNGGNILKPTPNMWITGAFGGEDQPRGPRQGALGSARSYWSVLVQGGHSPRRAGPWCWPLPRRSCGRRPAPQRRRGCRSHSPRPARSGGEGGGGVEGQGRVSEHWGPPGTHQFSPSHCQSGTGHLCPCSEGHPSDTQGCPCAMEGKLRQRHRLQGLGPKRINSPQVPKSSPLHHRDQQDRWLLWGGILGIKVLGGGEMGGK